MQRNCKHSCAISNFNPISKISKILDSPRVHPNKIRFNFELNNNDAMHSNYDSNNPSWFFSKEKKKNILITRRKISITTNLIFQTIQIRNFEKTFNFNHSYKSFHNKSHLPNDPDPETAQRQNSSCGKIDEYKREERSLERKEPSKFPSFSSTSTCI